MNAARHFGTDDLALFAMQLLPASDAAEIRAHVEQCAECRQELAAVQGDLATAAHTVDLHSSSAEARERLMKQAAKETKHTTVDSAAVAPERRAAVETSAPLSTYGRGLGSGDYLTDEPAPRRRGWHVLTWLGWVAAAALAFAAGSLYQQRDALEKIVATQSTTMNQTVPEAPGVATASELMATLTDPTAKHVLLNKSPEAKPLPQGRVTYVAGMGALVFVADNLTPVAPEKTYELWLIPTNGQPPIPAGTFRPDASGSASVILPPLQKGVEAQAFGVTIEAEGGATKPTLPIIMVGE